MNKRIRELAEQAGMNADKFGMYFAKDKHNEDGVDLEKFAELIVRECAVWVNDNLGLVDEEARKDLLRHFGVRE